MIKKVKRPSKLSMRETVQLMQQEVSGQDEKVKLVIIGKGKFWGGDYLFFTESRHPKYHNETYYEPVTPLKNQVFLHFCEKLCKLKNQTEVTERDRNDVS